MKTQARPRFGLYGIITVLNLATGLMFFMVSRPLPVADATSFQQIIVQRKVQAPAAIVGTPTRLEIASLSLDLPVGIGSYDPGSEEWTISLDKAYYADVSMPINDSNGVTLIYGHAQAPIFATLPEIASGATAIVTTDTGYKFTYTYVSQSDVIPTDTSLFRSDGPPTLILQTCSGDWSQTRALFTFSLTKEQKL